MIKILGYITLILIQFFSIQAIPISIAGGLIARVSGNLNLGNFIASCIIWFAISMLWFSIYNAHLPILAYSISIIYQFIQGNTNYKILSENSKNMMSAEIWGILTVALYQIIFGTIIWY